jgi:tetratricopeptide (TPR) repeat protein
MKVNKQIGDLTTKPIQRDIAGFKLTDSEKAQLIAAIPLIDQIIAYDPTTINSYSLKGKCLRATGKPQEAKVVYLTGLAVTSPIDNETDREIRSDLYLELAVIHFEERDFASAEAAIDQSIKLMSSATAHVVRGRLFQRKGDLKSAKEEALKALLDDADNENARRFFVELNPPKAGS